MASPQKSEAESTHTEVLRLKRVIEKKKADHAGRRRPTPCYFDGLSHQQPHFLTEQLSYRQY